MQVETVRRSTRGIVDPRGMPLGDTSLPRIECMRSPCINPLAWARPVTGRRRAFMMRDAGVDFWYDLNFVTLGTTPFASGTAPPAVTISGALTPALGLYIQCDGAGTLGVGAPTFKWSEDNGSTFRATQVPMAASVNLATTNGTIAVAFPAQAYLTDNIYRATVQTILDRGPRGHDITNATAAQQGLCIANAKNGHYGVRLDGVNDWYTGTWSTVAAQPFTDFIVYKSIGGPGASGAHDIIYDGGVAGHCILISDSTPQLILNAGASITYAASVANGAYAIVTGQYNTAAGILRVNGVQRATGSLSTNVPGGFTLGALANNTRWTNIEVVEVVRVFNGAVNVIAAFLTKLEYYLNQKYLVF
jgi:hypothetical protein